MSFVSVNSGFQEVFNLLKKKCYVPNKKCPKCGRYTLLQPGGINRLTGRPNVPPVCYHCGYRAHYPHAAKQNFLDKKQWRMRRKNAKLYFENHSILPSLKDFKAKTFHSFNAYTKPLKSIENQCKKAEHDMVLNHPVHLILIGNTGLGKTHLAYAIIHKMWNDLSYRPKILVINMVNTPLLQRRAIHDEPTEKYLDGILHQIGKADLVVLDDVGRESKTEWNQLVVNAVANMRTNKSLIITSNLDGFNRYSHQIRDRLTANSKGYIVDLRAVKSYRRLSRDKSKSKASKN